jgi:uncharacterized phage protein (TIGR01671 family)
VREIKFRAWDEGLMEYSSTDVFGLDAGDILQRFDNDNVMQFTGLYDKNGKEIYENDVVKIALNRHDKPMCIRHVVWECGRWAVEVGNGDFVTLDSCPGGYISRNEVQVIGNIYENPELVEGNDATA